MSTALSMKKQKEPLLTESKITVSTLVAYSVPLRNLLRKVQPVISKLDDAELEEKKEVIDAFKQAIALLNLTMISSATVRILNDKKKISEGVESAILDSDAVNSAAEIIADQLPTLSLPGDYIAIDTPIDQIIAAAHSSNEIETNRLLPDLTPDKLVPKIRQVSEILLGLFSKQKDSNDENPEGSDLFERFEAIIKRDFPGLNDPADIRNLFDALRGRDDSDTDDEFINKTENLPVAKKALILMGFVNAYYYQLEFGEPLEKEKILNKNPDPSYWHKWVSGILKPSFSDKILKDTFKNLWTVGFDEKLRKLIEKFSLTPEPAPPADRPTVDEAGRRTRSQDRKRRARRKKRQQKRATRTQANNPSPLPGNEISPESSVPDPRQYPQIQSGFKEAFINDVIGFIKPNFNSQSQTAAWAAILPKAKALLQSKNESLERQAAEIIEAIIHKLLKEENGKKELCN
jgi:hypothetical protein